MLGGIGAAAFWFLTEPSGLMPRTLAALGTGDATRGERIFWAGGCTSCHARPKAEGDAQLELAGGLELKTPFGTFVPPNISPDPQSGIGNWSLEDFANAMLRGVSPGRRALLSGFSLFLLCAHEAGRRRRPLRLHEDAAGRRGRGAGPQARLPVQHPPRARPVEAALSQRPAGDRASRRCAANRSLLGRYLVEGPGHCGECHTPRAFTGGTKKDQWLAGAVAAEGDGHRSQHHLGRGRHRRLVGERYRHFLETGFTPEFDSVGGAMVEVQKNMAQLQPDDRAAIAAYLKAVPPHPNGYPAKAQP